MIAKGISKTYGWRNVKKGGLLEIKRDIIMLEYNAKQTPVIPTPPIEAKKEGG